QGCIERCEIRRADFLEQFVAQMPTYMVQSKSVTLTRGCIYVGGDPVAIKPIKKFPYSNLVRIDRGAALQLGDQLCASDLRLALRSGKAVPAALALSGLRIAHVDDDGPVAGRAFTDVALHFSSRFALVSSAACSERRLSTLGPNAGSISVETICSTAV